jgi:hypothetical protein
LKSGVKHTLQIKIFKEQTTTSSKFFKICPPIFKIESDNRHYDFSEGKTALDSQMAQPVAPMPL